jgi:hypothetical protein
MIIPLHRDLPASGMALEINFPAGAYFCTGCAASHIFVQP